MISRNQLLQSHREQRALRPSHSLDVSHAPNQLLFASSHSFLSRQEFRNSLFNGGWTIELCCLRTLLSQVPNKAGPLGELPSSGFSCTTKKRQRGGIMLISQSDRNVPSP